MISNVVFVGRKFNELVERNKRNVIFYMEFDGVVYVFIFMDVEMVSINLRNLIVVIYYLRMWIEYVMIYIECDSDYLLW